METTRMAGAGLPEAWTQARRATAAVPAIVINGPAAPPRFRREPAAKTVLRREAGFTLLEVMVAFIIAALASVVLYRASFTGASENIAGGRYQEALVRAQSRLASIGPLTALHPEQLSGDDGGGFTWRLNIAPKAANGTLTLYNVEVTERFGNRQITLATERVVPGS